MSVAVSVTVDNVAPDASLNAMESFTFVAVRTGDLFVSTAPYEVEKLALAENPDSTTSQVAEVGAPFAITLNFDELARTPLPQRARTTYSPSGNPAVESEAFTTEFFTLTVRGVEVFGPTNWSTHLFAE